ncbi:MAG: TetR family transcriptional regulator [Actinomycetota bacterium]|nr:TetR family transcriptional regulator [Actinomycetota bacterium]
MGDATVTRGRILEAAISEFAEHGMAGARVDRLALRAECNKQSIYAYFGSKEGLFDAAVEAASAMLAPVVVLAPTDLAGYAVSLYDFMIEHPEAARLVRWHALERPGVAGSSPAMVQRNKRAVAAIAAAQRAGLVASHLPARMLLVFIISLVQTNEDERLVNRGKPIPHTEKRAALHAAVRLLTTPDTTPNTTSTQLEGGKKS